MLGLLAITSTPSAQPTAKLDGTWRAVAAERDGKSATDVVGHRLTFAGGTFTITRGRDGKPVYAGTYKTDPAKRPAQIDFDNTNAGPKGNWKGIYELDGVALKTCDNAPHGEGATDHIRRPGRLGPHFHRLHTGEILMRLKTVPSTGCAPAGSVGRRGRSQLDGEGAFILDGVDLDGEPHEGAGPAEDQTASGTLPRLALQHASPLGHGALPRLAAHAQSSEGHGRRRHRHGGRRGGGSQASSAGGLGELHDDAERLLRDEGRPPSIPGPMSSRLTTS